MPTTRTIMDDTNKIPKLTINVIILKPSQRNNQSLQAKKVLSKRRIKIDELSQKSLFDNQNYRYNIMSLSFLLVPPIIYKVFNCR